MSARTTADVRKTSVDDAEVARFSALAETWWDPKGKMGVLHKFNPIRLEYVRDHACRQFARDARSLKSLQDLRVLDIGCGGGLLSEPVARLGARVVGVDPSPTNVEVAKLHAATQGLAIDYRSGTAEDLAAAGETFDIVLNMEVVEHVADVPLYLESCAHMVRPGGLMFVATINRTLKAFALAIVGAEYVLGWLPKGTHQWDKFVKPDEIETPLVAAGMYSLASTGVAYNPLADEWRQSGDQDVNYMMVFARRRQNG